MGDRVVLHGATVVSNLHLIKIFPRVTLIMIAPQKWCNPTTTPHCAVSLQSLLYLRCRCSFLIGYHKYVAPLESMWPTYNCQSNCSVSYQEGTNFKRFFFRMTKIKGVKNWYCSLEMKEKFGMRPLAATS